MDVKKKLDKISIKLERNKVDNLFNLLSKKKVRPRSKADAVRIVVDNFLLHKATNKEALVSNE